MPKSKRPRTARVKKWPASKTFIDRFRYQANKAKQVQSRIKQLDKVKLIERQRDTRRVRFKFPRRPPAVTLELKGVAKSYGEKIIYRSLNFTVERGQRIALVGEMAPARARCSRCSPECCRSKGSRHVGHGVTPTTSPSIRPNR